MGNMWTGTKVKKGGDKCHRRMKRISIACGAGPCALDDRVNSHILYATMLFDLPLDQLRAYKPPRDEQPDFDAFWHTTLAEARHFALVPSFIPVHTGMTTVEVYDVVYQGYAGQSIRAWLIMPVARKGKLPCVVEYVGYGGGRGAPSDWLLWSAFGFAHLIMDTRGQGSSWLPGETPDIEDVPANPQTPGFMTKGVLSPASYYYRRVFVDAVRAVETARMHPDVDPRRIAVAGGSQGGGITLAVAGLVPDLCAALPDVPFLCHYRTATEVSDKDPYNEITRFCRIHRDKIDIVFKTLSYFDGVNFSARARCAALFSAGLMDETCPPRTVFAAYNNYSGEKSIEVYPFNQHEGGQAHHVQKKVAFLQRAFGL
jgi:cephalosporin-C deacetylase